MNNKVLDYLTDKKETFLDWLSANKTQITTNTKKAIAACTLLATLTNVAGCTNTNIGNPNNPSNNSSQGPSNIPQATAPELKPREEIEKDGITAQDVLDAYDQLALISLRYFNKDLKDILGDGYYITNATFNRLTPPQHTPGLIPDQTMQLLDFYPLEDYRISSAPWLDESQREQYNTYQISFVVDETNPLYPEFKTQTDCGSGLLVFPQDAFNDIALAFSAEPFQLTPDYCDQFYMDKQMNIDKYKNHSAYTNFIIDRDTILNANQQQLWALYNAVESFMQLNFGSKDSALEILNNNPENVME